MNRAPSTRIWLLVLAALGLMPRPVAAQAAERPPLPDYLVASVPEAIDRGKYFLQRAQKDTGTWAAAGEGNVVGYAALPALTLLELGTPANDPGIKRAADFVRASVASKELVNTYEVSLALLFLDRLGDKKDKPHIEVLAARLIAAQTPTGGWGYQVQYLDPKTKDTEDIIGTVRKLEREPLPLHHLLAGRVSNMNNPFVKREPVPASESKAKGTVTIPPRLKFLPCFTPFGTYPLADPDPKETSRPPFLGRTDNSTTQFALLALWAARRHNIPCTRTGAMTFMRFHTCQNGDGSWGYEYRNGGSGGTPTMTNTGLLGMAVGHGIVKELKFQDDPPVDEDPRILNGFKALGGFLGEPQDKIKDIPYPNLYFLWGLERVCVLYGVEAVGNKDWYRWGAEALLANQEPDGSWFKKDNYPGAAPVIDTSFALMFLKRANLAKDLSAYLAFSPKKLNEGVVKLMPPPPPKVEPKPEPPKVVETKPEPKPEPPMVTPPVQVAAAKPPDTPAATPPPKKMQPPPDAAAQPTGPPESGGSAWWIWVIIGLGGVMIVGGVLFFFLFSGGGDRDDDEDDEDDEEDDRPRKKKKRRR